MPTPSSFYDSLTPDYHLLYADWEASIARQTGELDSVIREYWPNAHTILDAACGIGTQSLGLAKLGYTVSGSDISDVAVARARREAEARGLAIEFRQADMRRVAECWTGTFDVVLACDNAISHLLSDEEIVAALRQFRALTRPGGGVILSVRDYAAMTLGGTQFQPRTVHVEGDTRVVIFDVWEFTGDTYEMSMYVIRDNRRDPPQVRVMRGTCRPIGTDRLEALLAEAGYAGVQTLRDRYFQPLLVGTNPQG